MKKYFIVTGLCALTALAGCAADESKSGVYQQSGNTINLTEQNELYNENGVRNHGDKASNFGFVRHQRSPVPGDANIYSTLPQLDREKMADLISKIATQIPHVKDVGTLVTDEEVLVAYDTDTKDRNLTADQVKRSAASVVPRFYHIYVSDDPSMIQDIERFGNLDADSRNVDQIITSTIQRMLKSPQGKDLSEGENANGEDEGGINPQYDRNMKNIPKHLQNPNTNNNTDTKTSNTRNQGETNSGASFKGNMSTENR